MVYDPHKHWHLLQIRVYFFIFLSKRENCLCPLLKDPRGPRTITVLWFISLTAQSEVQRGDICFAFCARNFQGFVYVCSFVLSSENFTLLGHACTCSVASFESDICDPMDCSPPGSSAWDSPGENTGVGCHFLLQGISPA